MSTSLFSFDAPSTRAAPFLQPVLAGPAHSRQTPMVIAILALHGVALFGLMNLQRVRETVRESAPIFLHIVAAPKPPSQPVPAPRRPRVNAPEPQPVIAPLVAPSPSRSPSPLLAQTPLAAPPVQAVDAVQTAPTPPAPAPAPFPMVHDIPASAVQYLVPPAPVYSRSSARLKEFGRAVVRVYIDEAGLPRSVEISRSSGFARLDDSAVFAVKNARFKPYAENGIAVAGWAFIPIEFELPK